MTPSPTNPFWESAWFEPSTWVFASLFALTLIVGAVWEPAYLALLLIVPLFLIGHWDVNQERHAVLRNFPLLGHFRYLLELIRPEINQYFIEVEYRRTTVRPGEPLADLCALEEAAADHAFRDAEGRPGAGLRVDQSLDERARAGGATAANHDRGRALSPAL